MRAFCFLASLAVAVGVCDTSTCYHCLEDPQCGWFEQAGFSDCRIKANVPATIATPVNCSMCQAGNCDDCTNQTSCGWFTNTNQLLGGTCALNTSSPSSTLGSFVLATTCPACKGFTSCGPCNAAPNGTNCGWYQLPGGADAKCREASPGFAYTKITTDYCNGNPCAGKETCSACRAVNSTTSNASLCAWYNPKPALAALYNSKCDVDAVGVLSDVLYDKSTGVCPVCAGTTCTACKAEANCQWAATSVGNYFGQCIGSTVTPATGKVAIATCPAECQVYSCKDCIARSQCRWFTGSFASDDLCDRTGDANYHPTHTALSPTAACPLCKSNRCYECGSETGCGWYENNLGFTTVDGDCAPTPSPHTGQVLIAITDKKCKGNPNSASALAPGLALVLALFVYHN